MTEICGCCSAVIQLKFPRQWCQPQEKALLKILSHSKTKPSYFKHFKRGFKIFKYCDLKKYIYILFWTGELHSVHLKSTEQINGERKMMSVSSMEPILLVWSHRCNSNKSWVFSWRLKKCKICTSAVIPWRMRSLSYWCPSCGYKCSALGISDSHFLPASNWHNL